MVNGSFLLIALGCPLAFALGYFLPGLLDSVPRQQRAAVTRATSISPALSAVTRGSDGGTQGGGAFRHHATISREAPPPATALGGTRTSFSYSARSNDEEAACPSPSALRPLSR